jgi:hypothetical protein
MRNIAPKIIAGAISAGSQESSAHGWRAGHLARRKISVGVADDKKHGRASRGHLP